MTERILCIDPDGKSLARVHRQLERHFKVFPAQDAERALELLSTKGSFAAVVADVELPDVDGIGLLEAFAKRAPDMVRIVLTGNPGLAIEVVNRCEVFRFLTRPCPPERLIASLWDAIERFQVTTSERLALEQTQHGAMRLLSEILATNTPEVFDKQLAVKELAGELVRSLELPDTAGAALSLPDPWVIEAAAQLGRVGELGLPEHVSEKNRRGIDLSADETTFLERVPEIGAKLLENLPLYQSVAEIVRYQDHRFDGGPNPPRGTLLGNNLPLGARILKVARDMVDLEIEGHSPRDAFRALLHATGAYDPLVLQALAAHLHLGPDAAVNEFPPRSIPLANLRRGDVLAAPLVSGDGRMLMQTGHRITAVTLQRIRNYTRIHGVQEPLFVEDWRKDQAKRERLGR